MSIKANALVGQANSLVGTNVYLAAQGNLKFKQILEMTEKELRDALLLVRANALRARINEGEKYYLH